MKYLIIAVFTCFAMNVFAQKQKFDVVTFTAPQGWDKTVTENGVQLSTKNDGQGNYAAAVIVRSIASEGSPEENFRNSWEKLVKGTVNVTEVPQTTDMNIEKGWTCITGQSNYTDGNTKGLVTLVTATGNGKMANLVIMTNTSKYQTELLSFINSVELAPVPVNSASTTPTANNAKNSAVVGLWTDYILETTGYSINGMPQYTAGYLRKEYNFYPDGTYLFRNKQWLTKSANILFIYETGTYAVNGNQLTITPKSGKGGFWGKTSNSKEWGKFIKSSDYSLEKTSYTFEITHDPDYGDKIILKPGKPTARDGGKFNAPDDPYEFHYSKRDLESLIDNPPGLKTDFENKSITATQTNTTTQIESDKSSGAYNTNAAQLSGIWGQYVNESNTAGYDWREYYFNNDGTYQFLQKNISYLYQNDIVFAYEKGTYKLNGNQLTISPQNGTVERWSKAGGDKAGKLIKTEKRTLENITYTIDFNYFSGIKETNMVLQYNKQTARDGAWSNNNSFKNAWLYKRPFTPDKPSIELPAGTKIDFNYTPATAVTAAKKNNQPTTAVASPITGKIWEGTTTEKFSNAGGTSYNTGGFATNQYQFNTDGTYRFFSVTASHFTDTKSLQYESGTYTINGNQLTVTPIKGYNEEWSKIGKTSNGNSDVTNRAINETWGKKLKTSSRKLETVTYTFSIGKNGDRNALILQYSNGHTEREGNGNQTYLNETTTEKAVKLPVGMKW